MLLKSPFTFPPSRDMHHPAPLPTGSQLCLRFHHFMFIVLNSESVIKPGSGNIVQTHKSRLNSSLSKHAETQKRRRRRTAKEAAQTTEDQINIGWLCADHHNAPHRLYSSSSFELLIRPSLVPGPRHARLCFRLVRDRCAEYTHLAPGQRYS